MNEVKAAPTIETAGATIFHCKDSDFSGDMQILCRQIMEDAQSQVEVPKIDGNTILYEIDKRFINPDKPLPAIKTWAKMGNRPALTRNGIVLINAKPKQGKSFSVYALLSALICGKRFDSLQTLETPNLCIVFDTEMVEIDLQTRIKPLYKVIGDENRAKFQVCSLLSTPKQDRLNVIKDIVEQYNPSVIAIDQLADLIGDFNSSNESVAVFEPLKIFMAERTVFLILHQNKAKDDTNSKGHIGTLAEQNASEVYTIKKEKGIFELSLKMARFASSDDATPFCFSLSDDGEIISSEDIERSNNAQQREEYRIVFNKLFGDDKEITSGELANRIAATEGIKVRAAMKKIKIAFDFGVIDKDRRGNSVFYYLTPF